MAAVFSIKKIANFILWSIVSVTVCVSFAYAFLCSKMEIVDTRETFYFVVSPSLHLEASAHHITWSGGAGYLLEHDQREYAAFSAYFSKDEGEAAQNNLLEKEQSSVLISVSASPLYLKTKAQKEKASIWKGAFDSLFGCMQVLDTEIARMTKGGTQESGKRILQLLQRQFDFLSKEYEKIFPQYAKVCQKGVMSCRQIVEKVILVKDLRYFLCELCVDYVALTKGFAI